ncbi:MAG: hypothetical protein ACJA13_003056 [Paraglaciecola sp.]|jgi:hypothetical protein
MVYGNRFTNPAQNGLSAMELKRYLSMHYNTARQVKHKLLQATTEKDDQYPTGCNVQLDNVYWEGVCRGAASKTRLITAITLNEQGHPLLKVSVVKGSKFKVIAQWSDQYLWPQSMVISVNLTYFRAIPTE